MRTLLVILISLIAAGAEAQVASYPPGTTQAAMQAAINSLQAQIPVPATTTPSAGSLNGAPGSANTYVRSDFQIPITVQRTTTTTDASGNLSVTWSKPFVSATPTALLVPVNTSSTQPIVCNVKSRSQTAVTGYCWQSGTISITLAALPIVGNIFQNGAATVPVMVIGAEPTQ